MSKGKLSLVELGSEESSQVYFDHALDDIGNEISIDLL